jgi:hypothetical protein
MDIMEHQGAVLADRPRMIAAGEILSGGLGLTLTPFGEKFRQKRRFADCNASPNLVFNTPQSTSYAPPA